MFDPTDMRSASLYRRTYGEAARLVEVARFDHAFGRDFAAGIGGHAEAILAEVKRRVGPEADPETVQLAIEDAIAGRRPRW
jgi:hypothetical protein